MKKALSITLALTLLVAVFSITGCKSASKPVKFGLGSVTSIASSKDATDTANAQAQGDTTVVAVVLDKDGKILAVNIDTVQIKVAFDEDMAVVNRDAAIKTKKELGPEYNMKGQSAIGKEWNEQIASLEEWMIGKTVAEVKAMKRKEAGGHTDVPDIPELTSSVTITVGEYIAALEKAAANTIEVTGYSTLGLGITGTIASSKDATDSATATAQADADMVAAAFDKDGKVVGVIMDVVQAKVTYDAEGKVTADKAAVIKTKKELGDAYNMKGQSPIGKEWFEQIKSLEEWIVGKAASAVTGLKLSDKGAPEAPELTSSVTITIDSLIATFGKANSGKK